MSKLLQATQALKGVVSESSSVSKSHTTTVKFNFDLDEIFSADVERFGKLKEVLKFLLEN